MGLYIDTVPKGASLGFKKRPIVLLDTVAQDVSIGFQEGLFSSVDAVLQGGYKLRDEFHTDRAAGAVHGTPCEPGPGTRHVVDTDSKLTITNGKLSMAPHSTPTWGDPGLWIDEAITRAKGVMLKGQINVVDVSNILHLGFDENKIGGISIGIGIITDKMNVRDGNVPIVAVFVPVDGVDYELVTILKAAGQAYFIKDSGTWKFLGNWGTNSTAIHYAGIINKNATFTSDYFPRVPETLWLPVPLCSDGFNRSDGAIGDTDGEGHAETSGLGSGGDGLTWTGATWTIDTNKAKNTPTEGAELWDADAAVFTSGTYSWAALGNNTIANVGNALEITWVDTSAGARVYFRDSSDLSSDLTIGQWYAFHLDSKINIASYNLLAYDGTTSLTKAGLTNTSLATQCFSFCARSATGGYINTGGFSAGEVITFDNLSLKPLTLSTLFSSLTLSTQDVVATCNATIEAGTQAGMVLNLDDAASPANFIVCYHDGVNCKLEKCVAGTYTVVITAAATYDATAEMKVHKDSTSYELFYNNVKIGSTSTISDAGIVDNLLHGLFSTYSGNRIDGFNIYARGTQNQHAILDRY